MADLRTLKERHATVDELCQSTLWPKIEDFKIKYALNLAPLKAKALEFAPLLVGGWLVSILAQPATTKNTFIRTLGFGGYIAMAVALFFIFPEIRKIIKLGFAKMAAFLLLKNEIKRELIRHLDPSFSFDQVAQFPADVYKRSELFPSSYDRGHAEDRCTGRLGETQFELMEIATYKKIKTKNSNGQTQVSWQPIFTGLLLQAEFNKNFSGLTVVKTDSLEKNIGQFARTAQRIMGTFSKTKIVELENPEFEAIFQVSSTDATEARYLLTPIFMEKLLELRRVHGTEVQVSFLDSKIVMALPQTRTFFELKNGFDDLTSSCLGMSKDIIDVLSLIETLDLNNRLSKTATQKVGA